MSDREEMRAAREAGLKQRHETREARARERADLAIVREAIELLPATCRYHGDKLERERFYSYPGQACCDTGKLPLARRLAEEALERLTS